MVQLKSKNTLSPWKYIKGTGQLFWAGDMRAAWLRALNDKIKFNYYLLVNDDTFLFANALKSLFDYKKGVDENSIIAGSNKDPVTAIFSYSGRVLKNNYGIADSKVIPDYNSPQLCDFGNRNLMLIPAMVVDNIGILTDC